MERASTAHQKADCIEPQTEPTKSPSSKILQFAQVASKSRFQIHAPMPLVVSPALKRERPSAANSILTGVEHEPITMATSFLSVCVSESRWHEYYSAWEREWIQLHTERGWIELINSVYASHGQFLAFTNQCYLLVQHPLILEYVGQPLPRMQ
jgi:hypothetical protein